jgi:hypothetical protein
MHAAQRVTIGCLAIALAFIPATPFITPDPSWLPNLPLVVAIIAFLLAFGLSHIRSGLVGAGYQRCKSDKSGISIRGAADACGPARNDQLPRGSARLQRHHPIHHPHPPRLSDALVVFAIMMLLISIGLLHRIQSEPDLLWTLAPGRRRNGRNAKASEPTRFR